MKKLRGSLTAKIIAIFLIFTIGLAAAASTVCVIALAKLGVYTEGVEPTRAGVIADLTHSAAFQALCGYAQGEHELSENMNFRFEIRDSAGNVLYTDYAGEDAYSPNTYSDFMTDEGELSCTAYLLREFTVEDNAAITLNAYSLMARLRFGLIAIAVLGVLADIALFAFLMGAAGHRDGTDEITLAPLARLPFDVYAFGALLVGALCFIGLEELEDSFNVPEPLLLAVGLSAVGALLLHFFMTLSAKLKAGGLIRGCVIYKVLAWCFRMIKRFFTFVGSCLRSLPYLGRWAFALVGVLIVEFFYTGWFNWDIGKLLIGWFLERAALVLALLYAVGCFKKIREGARAIADGNTAYKIDTSKMRGELKAHAEDINNIGLGVQSAVREQMKSERMRTELITNVSHDIKTPLTSIVSYVDLLQKEQPENEKSREYLEVLSRQSAKLKKLIEDLIEASKASSGTLPVELGICDAGVVLAQLQGEYADKLAAAGIELVMTQPEKQIRINADGKYLWRVLDNLMNNICKYSMRGTRAYVALTEEAGSAVMTFRNISAKPLNVSADELMQRFVRGDSSRTTEGSGLGLSIADSLLKLQNARLDILTDGDLFKAIVTFPLVE